jgi:hypothetical protein
MIYENDQALLQNGRVHEVLMRRTYRLQQEMIPNFIRENVSGHPTASARQAKRSYRQAVIEVMAALDESDAQPEEALYEAVHDWKEECFAPDLSVKTETVDLYRSFQSWANVHDAPACSLEKFQDLLFEEAKLRVRFDHGRGFVVGRLKETQGEVKQESTATPSSFAVRRVGRPRKWDKVGA